jgi:hypothetical protein
MTNCLANATMHTELAAIAHPLAEDFPFQTVHQASPETTDTAIENTGAMSKIRISGTGPCCRTAYGRLATEILRYCRDVARKIQPMNLLKFLGHCGFVPPGGHG